MFGKIWHFITAIIGLFVTLCMFYLIALLFNIIPKDYMPEQLFPEQYQSFNSYLVKDAESKSATAKFSESLYEYINGQDTKGNPIKKEEEEEKPDPKSPITKAKEAIDDYNQTIQDQKQELDQY